MEKIKIKSIKLISTTDRYDLTVNSTKNFFANGILIHNTSSISSKVLCKKKLKSYEKMLKLMKLNIIDTHYDFIYASRKVIKNSDLNPNAQHYYDEDIWGITHNELKDLLMDGMTIYYEIVGYLPSGGEIQKDYDYGCEINKHKILIYRITYTNNSGKVFEFSAKQVQDWCKQNGLNAVPELYYGYAKDLYPFNGEINEVSIEKWRNEFLEFLKSKYNEKNCYICNNKVPEEGIVLRIEKNDFEAFKLKSNRFYERETKLLDNGISDIESEN